MGIVTNNQDPDKLGRVKVRFPWLGDQDESFWARAAAPMAGKGRGFYCLPEVDDEVLVAFEHGLIEFPYILGALWNGEDTPPASNDDGKNNIRVFQSRSGNLIRFEETEGKEKIEIKDVKGNSSIVFDASDGSVSISSAGKLKLHGKEIEITSDTGSKIEAGSDLKVQAQGNLTVKGIRVDIN